MSQLEAILTIERKNGQHATYTFDVGSDDLRILDEFAVFRLQHPSNLLRLFWQSTIEFMSMQLEEKKVLDDIVKTVKDNLGINAIAVTGQIYPVECIHCGTHGHTNVPPHSSGLGICPACTAGKTDQQVWTELEARIGKLRDL